MERGNATPHRVRWFRWWTAAKILGRHGAVRRRVTREEFARTLTQSAEGAADE